MNPITFECPHCHELNAGDESMYGQQLKCRECQTTILVPPAPVRAQPQTARLMPEPAADAPPGLDTAGQETEIFKLSPVVRAYPGQLLLGMILMAVAAALAIRARDFSWPPWVALVPLALGLLLLLLVRIRVKSCRYRLTTQRLFIRRGWCAREANDLGQAISSPRFTPIALIPDPDEVLRVKGVAELTAYNVQLVRRETNAALNGHTSIAIDLSDTIGMDCSGLGALIALRNCARGRNGVARFMSLTPGRAPTARDRLPGRVRPHSAQPA